MPESTQFNQSKSKEHRNMHKDKVIHGHPNRIP